MSSNKITVINGPNLNLLGTRDPDTYGTATLDDILASLEQRAAPSGYSVYLFQSNGEGAIVDAIQQAGRDSAGVILNPAAYSHTSVAIRDAVEMLTIPVIEVHLSNIYRRESFRRHSYVSEVADGIIAGLGAGGYVLALEAIIELLRSDSE